MALFRPRLPLDPFEPQPWSSSSSSLANLSSSHSHFILFIGAPSPIDLAPFTTSPFLSNSLLILATNTPPPISTFPHQSQGPAIIILHLTAPLNIHDNGALRLLSLLQRAQRVAHTWLATRHSQSRIQQLAEHFPGAHFTRREAVQLASTPSPTNSFPLLPDFGPVKFDSKSPIIQFTALINFLPPNLPDKALLKHAVLVTTLSAPFINPNSITNTHPYIPSLKKSRRSLPPPSKSTPNLTAKRSRLSAFFSSTSTTPSTSTAPSQESLSQSHKGKQKQHDPIQAHIIHVLPYSAFSSPAPPSTPNLHPNLLRIRVTSDSGQSSSNSKPRVHKTKLVQSIEHFLLAHAYPHNVNASAGNSSRPTSMYSTCSISTLGSSIPIMPEQSHSQGQGSIVPFLVPAGVLGSVPLSGRGITIAEMMVLGALDGVAGGGGDQGGEWGMHDGEWDGGRWPRAWIGDGAEVVLGVPHPGRIMPTPMSVLTPVRASTLNGAHTGEKDREREELLMQRLQVPHEHQRKGRQIKVNKAGLPTPPESSSSLDGSGSEEEIGKGRLLSPLDEQWDDQAKGSRREWTIDGDGDGVPVRVPSNSTWGTHSENKHVEGNKEKAKVNKLKSRVSSLFRLGSGTPLKARVY